VRLIIKKSKYKNKGKERLLGKVSCLETFHY